MFIPTRKGVLVIVAALLLIAAAGYIAFMRFHLVLGKLTLWLPAIAILIAIAAVCQPRLGKFVSRIGQRLFAVAKFAALCVFLVALAGFVVRLSSNEGLTILAFDDTTKDGKYSGKAIADSLQVELLRIRNILSRKRSDVNTTERLISVPFQQESEKLTESLKDIGTLGTGEAKISIGALLIACKRFWPVGNVGIIITGGTERFGESIRIVAHVETNNEVRGYEVTRPFTSEEEVFDMVHELAFKIAKDLQDPAHPIRAKTPIGFQRFTEALEWYDRFHETGDNEDLEFAKRSCSDAFACETDYISLFDLFTNIGVAYADNKDYQSAADAFEKAVWLQPTSPVALNNLGLMLARLQRTEEAREAFNKAKSLSGDTAEAVAAYYTNLGDAQFYANRLDEAEQTYSVAIGTPIMSSATVSRGAAKNLYPACLGLARVYLAKKNYDSAKHCFETAESLDRQYAEPHLGLGDLFFAMAKYADARAEYNQALNRDLGNAEALSGLGDIALELGDLDTAKTYYERAIDSASSYSSPHVGLGTVLQMRGDADGAQREFSRAEEVDPLDEYPHIGRGDFLCARADLEEAISEYRRALELNPRSVRAHVSLGDVLRLQNKLDEARNEYGTAENLSQNDSQVFAALGEWYKAKHDYENAERLYRRAIEVIPESPWPKIKLGYLYEAKGDLPSATKEFQSALEKAPDLADAIKGLADVYYDAGDYKNAREQYSLAIQKAPGWPDPYLGRGNSYYALRDFENAASDYNRVIGISPLYAEGHADLGDIYCREGNFDKAIEEYSSAVKSDPGDFYAHTQLGAALLMKGKLEEAATHFESAYKLKPTDYGPGFFQGVLSLLRHQAKEAELTWNKVLNEADCRSVDDKLYRVMILYALNRENEASELFQNEISSLPVQPTGLLVERRDLLNVPMLSKSGHFMHCRELFAATTAKINSVTSGQSGKAAPKTSGVSRTSAKE
jgi:tetratricopeptide (TPR) repeat protein